MSCKFLLQACMTIYGKYALHMIYELDVYHELFTIVNCPTVICLPNTCYFGELPLVKLGTPVHITPSNIFRAIVSVVAIAFVTLLLLLLS